MKETGEFVISVRIRQSEDGAEDLEDDGDDEKNEYADEISAAFDLAGIIAKDKVIAAVINAASAFRGPDNASANREEKSNNGKENGEEAKRCK